MLVLLCVYICLFCVYTYKCGGMNWFLKLGLLEEQ